MQHDERIDLSGTKPFLKDLEDVEINLYDNVWCTMSCENHGKLTVYGFSYYLGSWMVDAEDQRGKEHHFAPQVLVHHPVIVDADGVEIRVGGTVCGTRDMEPMKVVDIDSHECGFKHIKCEKEGDGFWFYCPNELTHKLPVLAADGRPLREGEHVWHVETGTELVVKELPKPGEYQAVVVFAPPASHLTSFDPDLLTHERPDSWERLEEDAKSENPVLYCKKRGIDCEDMPPVQAIRVDLVCRAKKLAERDA